MWFSRNFLSRPISKSLRRIKIIKIPQRHIIVSGGIFIYKQKKLPYEYDALEPFIDTHTLGLHYNKHQKNYLNKLNELLLKNNYKFDYPIEELENHMEEFQEEDRENIRFNLGGVINHNWYFASMGKEKVLPNEILLNEIKNTFESYEGFTKKLKESALSMKGSGYTYLVVKKGKLEIVNYLNQDNPYNHNVLPLIALDMWEHAYYINYENKKDIYIDNFLEIINFTEANKIFHRV